MRPPSRSDAGSTGRREVAAFDGGDRTSDKLLAFAKHTHDVVVVDMPATPSLGAPPEHLPPLLTDEEAAAAKAAFAAALEAGKDVDLSVCTMPLALAHKWEAMRDCVGRGREHKYDRLQSEYHYTKDRALLAEALRGVPPEEPGS